MSIKPDFEEHIEETPEKEDGEGFEIHGVDDFINAVLVMNILARVSLSWLRKLGGRRHLPAIFEDIRLIQKRSAEVKTYFWESLGKQCCFQSQTALFPVLVGDKTFIETHTIF